MTIWHHEHDVTLHCGDAAQVLHTLDAGSVQTVVTSPPYYGLRDYGTDGQIGLEPSPTLYVDSLVAVMAQVRRVLRDDGTLWLNLGDSYHANAGTNGGYSAKSTLRDGHVSDSEKYRQANEMRRSLRLQTDVGPKNLLGMPWRVAFALQDQGWTLRNAIIWHKPNAMPESVTDRLSTTYEHLFLLTKSRRYWFNLEPIREPLADVSIARSLSGPRLVPRLTPGDGRPPHLHQSLTGRNPGDVWTIPTSPYPGAHFATFPPALAKRCILAGCPPGGVVLDPFAGSGTTLAVARALMRRSVGIDISPAYCALAVARLGDPVLDFDTEPAPARSAPEQLALL